MSSPTLDSILLIDDDEISNLFNQIFIGKLELNVEVDIVLNGLEAIDYLKENILDKKGRPVSHIFSCWIFECP